MLQLPTALRAACSVLLALLVALPSGAQTPSTRVDDAKTSVRKDFVAPPRVSLWAQRTSGSDAIDWPGSENVVQGLVHSNAGIKLAGSKNQLRAPVRYVTQYHNGGGENQFASAPTKVTAQALPYAVDVASYAPGGAVAQALGAAYFNKSSVCSSQGKWQISQQHFPLAPGVYYAPCDIELSASNINGHVTLVTTGRLQLSGSDMQFTPYYRGVQFATSSAQDQALKLSGSRLSIGGLVWAPNAKIEPSGSDGSFSCGLVAGAILFSGSKNQVGNGGCGVAPDARDSAVTTPEDTAVAIVLDGGDADQDIASWEIIASPTHGSLSGTAPNLTYTPAPNYHGPDELTFRIVDSFGQTDTAKVRITVTPVNVPPAAQPQTLETPEGTVLPIVLTGTDPEGDALSYAVIDAPTQGTLSGTAPNVVYTPGANYHGPDSFTFRVNDGQFDSEPAPIQIQVRPLNDAPAVQPQSLVTPEDTALSIVLTGTDPDDDALTYTVVDVPTHGTLSGTAPNLVYTPAANYHGPDSFTFRVNDGELNSAPVTIDVTVTPVNDPPVAHDQQLETNKDTPLPITLTGTDSEDAALSYTVLDAPTHGTLSGTVPAVVYTPNPGYAGPDAFTFRVSDAEIDSALATISMVVIGPNGSPEIVSTPSPSVNENTNYDYDVDAVDPDNDPLTYRTTLSPTGTQVVASSGAMSWLANDASLTSGLRLPNPMCREPSSGGAVGIVEKWNWSTSADLPLFNQVGVSPLVARLADTNGDGVVNDEDVPSVVFTAYHRDDLTGYGVTTGILRVLNGATGVELFHTSLETPVDGFGTAAIGDIDGDGRPDLVAPSADAGVIAFEANGTIKWRTAPLHATNRWGRVVTLADLDGDGSVEIIVGNTVLDARGKVLWRLGQFTGYNQPDASGLVSVADIDGDGKQEVVAGASAYASDGSTKWKNAAVGDGYTAIADFDGDGNPEIAVVRSAVWLIRHDGTVVWGPVSIPGGGSGGPPTIGDADGDGRPEIGVAAAMRYTVFDTNGTILWSKPTRDFSSHATGSTVFDLDGDGRVEVLYSDEQAFRVYAGSTGEIIHEISSTSATAFEYPVVADIDLDGEADILVASNELLQLAGRDPTPATRGVRAFESVGHGWMATRSIWNQHAYHIDNVNDDGTIPRQPAKSWLSHNTFRLNTFPDRHPLGLADLALFDLRLDETSGTAIRVLVTNRGLAPTRAETSVSIFNGNTLLGTLAVPVLSAGEERTLALEGLAPSAVSTNLTARIDEANAIVECLDNNNSTAAAYFDVRATDPPGLFDSQRFTVAVQNVNVAPTITSTVLPPAAVNTTYRFRVLAQDTDLGDALRFELVGAPVGLKVEAVSGELRWAPTAAQAGTHSVRVRATDLGGLNAERSFDLLVSANHSPQITTTPITGATVGSEYRYDVDATDADGETLSYTFTLAPSGMQIDGATGLIRWTPAAAANVDVEVRVFDGRGGFALQRYTLQVVAPPNQAPQITSTPSTSASPGRAYTYLIDATDPDGDMLSVLLPIKPAGMTLNDRSGQISWTPTSAQLGTHAVQVQVIDGRGGTATQDFSIVVSEIAGNLPPSILSTPSFTAKAVREYRYPVLAEDPNGDALNYSLIQAPPGMTIAADGTIAWTPSAPGSASVRVRVADAQAYVEQTWTITVLAADVPLNTLVNITPNPVQPGGAITIQIVVEGAASQPTVTGTIDGQPLPLDPDGTTSITAPTTPGSHTIVVTVTDGSDTDTTEIAFNVVDPNGTAPQVTLLTPLLHPDHDTTEVTAPTRVTGSVQDTDLTRWELGFQDKSGGPIVALASGTDAFTARDLAEFDPTRLLNGQYHLVLQAWDAAGHHGFDARTLRVTGDLKLGHYAITFEEVSIPVAGIPVTVTRTYDTRRRLENGDFGYGWTVDANNVRVHESRRIGFGWQMHRLEQGFFDEYCLLPNGDPIVTVTLPDGQVESFKAKAHPECGPTPRVDVHVMFEAIDGTDSTLTSGSYGTVHLVGSNLVDLSDPQVRPIDPGGYTLTTAEGVAFRIDQFSGLQQVTEPNGQSLSYGEDGVHHSSGVGIDFVRDGQGRITQLKLPDDTTIDYAYDAAGDLIGLTDAAQEPASFGYHARFAHYLESITDARGVMVSRNEYDDQGKLVATIDAQGHRLEYAHDLDGRTAQVKDRRGHVTRYLYNDRGDVLAETNALNETTTHSYDEDGHELTRKDALHRTQRWGYDARGNVLTETNAANETTTSTFNPQNQLLTQVDAAGTTVMTNEYIDHGLNLISTRDALGNATTFRYDLGVGTSNTGQIDTIADAAGATTAIRYAAQSTYKYQETDALGHRTEFEHDAMGRMTEERRTRTKADGSVETLVTTNDYDAKGRVTKTTHPDGSTTTTEYDGLDAPSKECDALNRCTTHVYNARGEEIETGYPDGSSESKTYDANGNVESQTDRGGRTTTFVYDAANRLVETIHPDAEVDDGNDANNPRSKSVYDAAGQLTQSIDENGQVTRYEYDEAGRRHKTILTAVDGATATITDAYDEAGRRTTSTDAEGHVTTYRYDAAGRVIETRVEGTSMQVDYDAVGRKVADTDAQGRTTRYAYDKLGRLMAVVLPNPVTGVNPELVNGASPDSGTLTTRYGYDEFGNKLTQTDAEGRTTRWEYDRMGRELARVLPEGQRETKEYNVAGELVASTDFEGKTTRYRYDSVGRADQIDYPNDADVGFAYNAAGERSTVTDGRGTSTMGFDRRGRVVQSRDADGGIIEFQYDDFGNLMARISPSQSLAYEYDQRHRMVAVTRTVDGEAPMTTRYEYDQDGNRSAMLGGDGLRTEYTYDRRHRLTNLVKRTAVGAVLLAMQYTVDASGMRTAVAEADATGPVRAVAYAYDATKRLTQETIDHRDADKDRVTAWIYDDVGNRLLQTLTTGGTTETTAYAYDANDRLLSEVRTGGAAAGSTAYTYDANGNTLSKTGPGGATTYRYDDANRLVEAITPQGTSAYVYSADGLRVRQTVTPTGDVPTTTWYVQDTAYPYAQVVEEYTSQGAGPKQLAATFTFADELVSQTRYTNGTPTTRFIQADGFGSMRWLTDATGAITDSIAYDAFGVEIERAGTTDVDHQYRGEAFDKRIGLYYLRARWLAPQAGRFITMDEFEGKACEPVTLNKFAYANSDPANHADPSGNVALLTEVLFGSSMQTTVRRAEVSNKAQKAYSGLRNVCQSARSVGGELADSARHHVIPQFLRGTALKKRFDDVFVMSLDKAAHNQFHGLLDLALRMNGFAGRSDKRRGMTASRFYEDLYARNPAARADVLSILFDVAELFDSVCQDAMGGKSLATKVKGMKSLLD